MTVNRILPIVLSNKPSAAAKEQIKKLMGPRPVQFIYKLILTWATILGAIWVAVIIDQIIVTVIAMFIVASRQNILALLVHEQSHCLGFKAKRGDPIVNFFAAYPLFVLTVENYSQVHLAHHKYFFTEKDPDIVRKSGNQWEFPMHPIQLVKFLLSDLLGMNVIALIKGKRIISTEMFKRPHILPKWTQKAYYVVIFAIITFTHTWGIFLLYWCLPLVTIMQVFVRWGALCEHVYVPNATIIESSPIIVLSWWEKLLMPNINFSLHPYHHFYPGIAWCNLPKVHQIYIDEGLVDETKLFYGNLSYLKFLLDKSE